MTTKVVRGVLISGRDCCCMLCGRAPPRSTTHGAKNKRSAATRDEGTLSAFFGAPRGRALLRQRATSRDSADSAATQKSLSRPTSRKQAAFDDRRPLHATRRRSQYLREKTAMAKMKQREQSEGSQRDEEMSEDWVATGVDETPPVTGRSDERRRVQSTPPLPPSPLPDRVAPSTGPKTAGAVAGRHLSLASPPVTQAGQTGPNRSSMTSLTSMGVAKSVAEMRKNRVNEIVRKLEGYLLKNSKSIKGFEKRWFRVKESNTEMVLAYYVDHKEAAKADSEPRGVIPIAQIVEVSKHPKYEKQFMVIKDDGQEKKRTYLLKARDYIVRDHWVKGIRELQKELCLFDDDD
eukprot:Platyproteum_vivax@DN6528_c0_g1_i3.p1